MRLPASSQQKRFRVTGRVQGVFYRATTQQRARELGLTGRAKNMPDGSVEVVAQGTAEQLAALESFLWEGPRLARVDSVEGHPEVPSEEFSGFGTG